MPGRLNAVLVAAAGAALAGAALWLMRGTRGAQASGYGSATNASNAVDDVELKHGASSERVMDAGVEGTFPASDPVSVENAYESAYEREKRRGGAPAPARASPGARSPDWLTTR